MGFRTLFSSNSGTNVSIILSMTFPTLSTFDVINNENKNFTNRLTLRDAKP